MFLNINEFETISTSSSNKLDIAWHISNSSVISINSSTSTSLSGSSIKVFGVESGISI